MQKLLSTAVLNALITAVLFLCLGLSARAEETRFTEEESAWIRNHPEIIAAIDPDFPPVESFSPEGKPQGMTVDIARTLAERIGFRIKFLRTSDWKDSLAAVADHRADMLCAATQSLNRQKFLDFTKPVVEMTGVIITRPAHSGKLTMNDLIDKRVAVVSGYIFNDYIRDQFPGVIIQNVSDVKSGLRLVATGEVFAMVEHLSVASYYIQQEGISNLRIAGETPWHARLSIATRKDWPLLHQIFAKELARLSPAELRDIRNRWFLDLTPFYQKSAFWLISGGVTLFVLLMLIWNWSLRILVSQRTRKLCQELDDRVRAEQALRDQQEILRTTLDSDDDGILVVNNDSNIMNFNSRFIDMWQVPAEISSNSNDELLLQYVAEQVENTPAFIARVRELYQNESIQKEEILLKDGRAFERYTCPFWSGGRIIGRVWNFRDITRWRQTEAQIRASEEKFKMVLQLAPDAIFQLTPQGYILNVNETAIVITGYPIEELIGMNFKEIFPREELEKHPLDFELINQGRIITAERRIITRSSCLVDAEMISRMMPDRSILCFMRDISERRRAETALRQEREQLLSIFDSIDEFIYISDPDTYEIIYVNKAFEQLLGRKVIGNICYREFQNSDRPCDFCTNAIIREIQPKPYRWERFNPYLNKHFALVDRIIRWPDGRDVRFELATDISELKNTITEHEKLLLQLAQSQKMESVGRLAGGVAHDFNNMLGVILGYTDMVIRLTPPEHPSYPKLQEIRKAAQRSADLTRQLLTFARKQTVTPRVLDLNDTVHGMLKMIQRLIGEDIQLLWDEDPALCPVKIDPSQIDQILINLTVNARDAISGGGKITIETRNVTFSPEDCEMQSELIPGQYIMLSVSDNGCGMSEEVRSHLFEPFFTTKELGHGTGLGMATVYGIVKQNNGFINVYSEPGQGCTIKLYLPRNQEPQELQFHQESSSSHTHGHELILLVEDEPLLINLTIQILESLGYSVLPAQTPGEAIRLMELRRDDIDLLLSDVVMPEMNGRELVTRLQEIKPSLKVIFMSGYTANVVANHGVLDKGVDFISKPFHMEDLAQKVREVLDRSSDPAAG